MFHTIWLLGPIGAIIGLLAAYSFYNTMMKESEGNEMMTTIAGHVREGAHAYLRQQNKVVFGILFLTFGILLVLAFAKMQAMQVPFAFLLGGAFSAMAGYLGMVTATNASARTSNAAMEKGLNAALKVAFRSGAVMGLTVVGLALTFISASFFLMVKFCAGDNLEKLGEVTVIMVSFGMGASFQALFARVGGGIFTKAADVGADLVGKVEAGIPEDDPRNPATIADNVGDNVGDVAGMGADLYESYSSSILAAIALGVSAVIGLGGDANQQMAAAIVPIAIAGLGIISSVAGVFMVQTKEGANQKELIHALDKGIWGATAFVTIGSAVIINHLMGSLDFLPSKGGWLGLWGCVVLGLAVGLGIGKATEYYTSYDYKPTQHISAAGVTGPATVIIEGMAIGMISTYWPILFVIIGILGTFMLCSGFINITFGLYGVALAAVGMLSTLGITLATDAYGPIADNAGGNAEMSELPPEVREKTDLLDAVGNTTAAIGKGFAIGSAALTAMALLAAYGEELKVRLIKAATIAEANGKDFVPWGSPTDPTNVISLEQAQNATYENLMSWYDVTLLNPMVLVGLFIGGTLAFVFSALTMQAVGKAAMSMIEEVRRQFREKPGILKGEDTPDYAACVAISTADAQRQMILPAVLVVAVPMLVGVIFGPAAVMGLLTGGLVSGFLMAIMMANAGGAWDNAKKYVELGNHGGKGSEAHKAGVIGDTVGDPFKDTSGPALNVLIKLMAIAAVVFAGLTVNASPAVANALGFF